MNIVNIPLSPHFSKIHAFSPREAVQRYKEMDFKIVYYGYRPVVIKKSKLYYYPHEFDEKTAYSFLMYAYFNENKDCPDKNYGIMTKGIEKNTYYFLVFI